MFRLMPSWHSVARDRLLKLRRNPRGWGHGAEDVPYPEPTVLACLALLSADDEPVPPDTLERIEASAQWLADLQQEDGAVGVAEEFPSLCWSTACAALLWSRLSHYERPLADALRWLQQCEEFDQHASDDEVLCYRPAMGAWPWIEATGSRLEPASMAVLALCRNQLAGHQRIADSVRWILERSLAGGGWNLETTALSSAEQPPQAEPTGMVLLALRAAGLPETEEVTRACHYLSCVMPHTAAPEDLSWGLLGYLAWRPRPLGAEQWLGRSYERATGLADSPAGLAMLILAAHPATLALLGVSPARQEAAPAHELLPELLGA
jgi:hypothetical protein